MRSRSFLHIFFSCMFLAIFSAMLNVPSLAQETPPADTPSQSNVQETPLADDTTRPKTEVEQEAEQNVQQLGKRLFIAMDQLIPGEFEENAPLTKPLREVAEKFARQDLAGSQTQLEELVKANPILPPPGLLIAGMLISINQVDNSRLVLENAAIDNPENPGILSAFCRMAIGEGRWTDALALTEKIRRSVDAKQWNEDQKKHFEIEYLDAVADIAMGQKRFDEARVHLLELQKIVPENDRLNVRLAEVDFQQHNQDAALVRLQEAVKQNESLLPPELILFNWNIRTQNQELADKWIKVAAEKHSDDVNVQLEIGKRLLQKGNLTDASAWIEKAEKNNADAYLTKFIQGQIAFLRRSYRVAMSIFNDLSLQRPNDFGAKNMLALCMLESGDKTKYPLAVDLATNNLRLNQRSPQAAATLAWAYYRSGDREKANQLLSQIAQMQNVHPDAAYYIAHLVSDEGRFQEAANLLEKSLLSANVFLYRNNAESMLEDLKERLAEEDPPKSDDSDKK